MADNTFATARAVIPSATFGVFNDRIDPIDTTDFYTFTLASRSSLNLSLKGLSADADLKLYNASSPFALIAESNKLDLANEAIDRNLEAGTYYIEVYSPFNTAATDYNLSVRVQSGTSGINSAPTGLQFNPSQSTYAISNSTRLELTDAWVYDANGSVDIAKVDFWLLRPDGTWQDVADATASKPAFSTPDFTPWATDANWSKIDYSLYLGTGSGFFPGEYTLWGKAYDNSGAVSEAVTKTFTLQTNQAPTGVQFKLDKSTYNFGDTLNLTEGWVYDGNGASDLSSVRFEIVGSLGTYQIGEVTTFSPWTPDNRWGGFNYSYNLADFGSGNFTLKAIASDKGGNTTTLERNFTVEPKNFAPESLNFGASKFAYSSGESLALSGTVIDKNEFGDLARVDFWLQRPDGTWLDVSDATIFSPIGASKVNTSFNHSINLSGLADGEYTVWGKAYDKKGLASNVIERTITIQPGGSNAPELFEFSTNKETYLPTDSIQLNGYIFDPNGGNTVARVDLWVKKPDGTWVDLTDTTTFTPTPFFTEVSFTSAVNLSALGLSADGAYTFWAKAYDSTGFGSNSLEQTINLRADGKAAPVLDYSFINPSIRGNNSFKATETVTIFTGVSDQNGIGDIAAVDYWLQRPNGTWIDIADPTPINNNFLTHTLNLAALQGLEVGTYTLWAKARDQGGLTSNIIERTFSIVPANSAPFNLKIEQVDAGKNNVASVNVTGSFQDPDSRFGFNDVKRIDFWLKKPDGTWLDIQDLNVAPGSPSNFTYSLNLQQLSLSNGSYLLWARAYDQNGVGSNAAEHALNIFDAALV